MASLDNCFVAVLKEPVQVVDVPLQAPAAVDGSAPSPGTPRQAQLSTLEELTQYLDANPCDSYACRLISVCQRTSWRPLQVTRPMMDLVVSRHDADPSFWQLPSCFYTRNLELEQVHCIPYTETRKGAVVELSYTIKYPEFKESEKKWVIRQTGIWHRYNMRTSQSTYVLLSPTVNSKAHQQAVEWMLSSGVKPQTEPFWLHRILFASYLPSWRRYVGALEHQLLPIANTTFASFIDEPLRFGYDHLSELVSLETKFLQVPAILETSSETLVELGLLLVNMSEIAANHPGTRQLKNYQRQCGVYSRTAVHLQARTQTTARLLADTLSFRDQVVAKEQNGNMLQLNKSAVFITTLTLLYLPASFVASFFGMNFFDFDQEANSIVGTPMVWIYVVASAGLTAITFLFYYWLLHRDNTVFRRLAPKVRASPDWTLKNLTRRLTSNAKDAAIEMESCKV
ncbi:hypothetical protein QBC47DRAFT_389172 [Echria macrotheca]|uniref:CorA-like transporter domain-containing protein n=1 Tax=Echria macrotheca TaxID=438768 RepID=A0AAJ0B725_9PEZI|nr:hypothetical protein QBC47DRAFT_389172 [Echria macrotheca]